jgi:23S rRNA (cytosine1962-C5)-methyltransferase
MSGTGPFRLAGELRLRAGREVPVRRGHPWVYRGALEGPVPPGPGPFAVRAADGTRLGVAIAGEPQRSLALRMVAFGAEQWNRDVLHGRLREAVALRERLALNADAYRLVHAEGDRLPGLVVDRYGPWAVVEPFAVSWEPLLGAVAAFLVEELRFEGVLLRRGRAVEVLHGALPEGPVTVREGTVRLPADLVAGQKTGLFLDQRENRRRVASLAGGRELLNLFSYGGGFAVAALRGGARAAVNVDAAPAALDLARAAYALNELTGEDGTFVQGDAFQVTRDMVAAGRRFDLLVVDPPAFVKRRSELAGGLRGYKDINLQALRLAAPGALLLSCSCSALVGDDAFEQALTAAAADAGRFVRVLDRRGAGPDHPVALVAPETRHLKAWLCHVA